MAGIKIRRINHVALPIGDRRESLPFYRDLLGLKVIPSMVDSPGVTWLQIADGAMVHPVEPRTDGTPPSWHVAFEVEDFDATVEALTEAGIKIESRGVRHDGQQYPEVQVLVEPLALDARLARSPRGGRRRIGRPIRPGKRENRGDDIS